MTILDFLLIGLFLGGAAYLLFRSLYKNKGHCAGCSKYGCTIRESPFRKKDDLRQ
jgi:hypothetical protein